MDNKIERRMKRSLGVGIVAACIALLPLAGMPTIAGAQSTSAAGTSVSPGRIETPAWAAFSHEWSGIAGYSATVTVFEQKGTADEHMVLDYTFGKPAKATVHIVAGANSGVTLVWDGGSTMQAHRGSGLMASFKKTFALDDPRVTTVRGSTIDQLSFDAFLTHAQQTPGAVSQAPGPPIDGTATDAVTLVPSNSESNGLTLEVVDVSQATHLPMRVLGYEGSVLVRSVDFSDVKLVR
jgi:outer membrane lipoprotein-sorting protein